MMCDYLVKYDMYKCVSTDMILEIPLWEHHSSRDMKCNSTYIILIVKILNKQNNVREHH